MLFNSLSFLLLVAITVPLYFFLARFKRQNWQICLLLLSSLIFYAWGQPALLALLVVSSVVNATGAWVLAGAKEQPRYLLSGLVAFNLLLLAFFKYAALFVSTVFPSLEATNALEAIPLPVGISFFTFQGISLVVDVARDRELGNLIRRDNLAKSLLKMTTYISLFPQLVAGPIVKAKSFIPQYRVVGLSAINFPVAAKHLITGFFFKMVVADNLKDFTVFLQESQFGGMKAGDLLLVLYGYSFQIYADFMGYSLIAVGLGVLFGYRFPENFRLPYISKGFSEFWTRWHVSLSLWLREYLYFPLGGNRKGTNRTLVNLMIVMLLGGLWHGAGWNYLLWGGAHGLALVAERLLTGKRAKASIFGPGRIREAISMLFVFHVVTVLWLFFILPDVESFQAYWKSVFSRPMSISPNIGFGILLFGIPVVLQHLWGLFGKGKKSFCEDGLVDDQGALSTPECIVLGTMLALIVLNSGTAGQFIYFQF